MTVKDLNETIVRKARKQGITHWESMRSYNEFAFKIVVDYIEKLDVVHPPLKINANIALDIISITSSELSVAANYELFYTNVDYHALDYPEEHDDKLTVYSIDTLREPSEIGDILDEAIEKVNLRILNGLVDKHFEGTTKQHVEYIFKKYGFHIIRDTAGFKRLRYSDAVGLMEYIEAHEEDFPPEKISFIRKLFDYLTNRYLTNYGG